MDHTTTKESKDQPSSQHLAQHQPVMTLLQSFTLAGKSVDHQLLPDSAPVFSAAASSEITGFHFPLFTTEKFYCLNFNKVTQLSTQSSSNCKICLL